MPIRHNIFDVLNKVLACNTWALWYATLQCQSCGELKRINFTCWSRFCFSCSKPASDKRTYKLLSRLPQNISYRHIFFTIPEELRKFFAINRSGHWSKEDAINILSTAANEALYTFFQTHFNSMPWFISVIHTFWAKLNRNPHIHYIVAEWWFVKFMGKHIRVDTQWKYMHYYHFIKIWRAIFAKHLREYSQRNFSVSQQITFSKLISSLFTKDWCVFLTRGKASYLHTLIWYLSRYLKRPVIWISRITHYDWEYVSFDYFDKYHKKIENTTVIAEYFLWLLIRHIPDRNRKYVRYWGFFANRIKANFLPIIKRLHPSFILQKFYIPLYYADRLRRTYGKHPLKCSCSGFFTIIWFTYPNQFIDTW